MTPLDRAMLIERLGDTASVVRMVADATEDRLEGLRLESLADTLDAERRTQGQYVPVRRRVSGEFAEV